MGSEETAVDSVFARFGLSTELARIKKQLERENKARRDSPTAASSPGSTGAVTFESLLHDLPGNNTPDLGEACTIMSVLNNPGVRRDPISIPASQFRKAFRFLEPAEDPYGITQETEAKPHAHQQQQQASQQAQQQQKPRGHPVVKQGHEQAEAAAPRRSAAKLRISIKGTTAAVQRGESGEQDTKKAKREPS